MSKETLETLNTKIMIGNGYRPWWYREELVNPENMFDGPIPVEAILERLFHWEPEAWPTQAFEPGKGAAGRKTIKDSKRYAIVRPPGSYDADDPGQIYYYGGQESYKIHERRDWLLGVAQNILGEDVVIESAAELGDGAEAFIGISIPESITHAGVEFRPRFTLGTSCNGRLSTQGGAHAHLSVCDNSFALNIREARDAGRLVKVRHSKNSVDAGVIQRYSVAMGILEEQAQEFTRTVEILTNIRVTDDQWAAFLNEYAGDLASLSGREVTFAETARAALNSEWLGDNLTSAPWAGTAFGALQAANTYAHHNKIRRGGLDGRIQANLRETLTGAWGEHDDRALEALLRAGVPVPVLS